MSSDKIFIYKYVWTGVKDGELLRCILKRDFNLDLKIDVIKTIFDRKIEALFLLGAETGDKCLLRVNNDSDELEKMRSRIIDLSVLGIGPKVIFNFVNGFIYEYIEGADFAAVDLENEKMLESVMKEMARWHNINIDSIKNDKYLGNKKELHSRFYDHKIVKELKQELLMEKYLDYIKKIMERELVIPAAELIKLCHNDVHAGNIIKCNESVKFIDQEYAQVGNIIYDIANFFSEMRGFELDDKRYPVADLRMRLIKVYCTERWPKLSPAELEKYQNCIAAEIKHFSFISNFNWWFWSFKRKANNSNEINCTYEKKRWSQLVEAAGIGK